MKLKGLDFNSRLIHGVEINDGYNSANVPIYQTSTFYFKTADEGARCFSDDCDGYIYTRIGNPTITALEKLIADLENGYDGIATSSGMAAINTIYMTLLKSGDHMVSTDAVYGPARGLMENYFSQLGIQSTYINTTDINKIRSAIKPNTKVLYIETPANPTLGITDLKACSKLAKEKGILLVVDNTFCSPYLQKPLDFGADIVFHSMTKFINGHADIVAGMIVTKEKEMYNKLRKTMIATGCNMDPYQSFMVLRGIKTLSIRIERAQENAMKIAKFLEKNSKVAWVSYPGLKSHPQFKLASTQMDGFGSIISFGLKGGFKAAKKLLDNVHLALLAVSLGGVETLIQHPSSMTHSKVSKEDKLKAGITDDLIRLSVGIESVDDIINDLKQGLGSK
jgi:methionine-gamma-lyase